MDFAMSVSISECPRCYVINPTFNVVESLAPNVECEAHGAVVQSEDMTQVLTAAVSSNRYTDFLVAPSFSSHMYE